MGLEVSGILPSPGSTTHSWTRGRIAVPVSSRQPDKIVERDSLRCVTHRTQHETIQTICLYSGATFREERSKPKPKTKPFLIRRVHKRHSMLPCKEKVATWASTKAVKKDKTYRGNDIFLSRYLRNAFAMRNEDCSGWDGGLYLRGTCKFVTSLKKLQKKCSWQQSDVTSVHLLLLVGEKSYICHQIAVLLFELLFIVINTWFVVFVEFARRVRVSKPGKLSPANFNYLLYIR